MLAQTTGLSESMIDGLQSGRRIHTFRTLIVLADALHVSADYLLGRTSTGRADKAWDSLKAAWGGLTPTGKQRVAKYAETWDSR